MPIGNKIYGIELSPDAKGYHATDLDIDDGQISSVLHKEGNNYVAYGESARVLSKALGLTLGSAEVNGEKYASVIIPSKNIDSAYKTLSKYNVSNMATKDGIKINFFSENPDNQLNNQSAWAKVLNTAKNIFDGAKDAKLILKNAIDANKNFDLNLAFDNNTNLKVGADIVTDGITAILKNLPELRGSNIQIDGKVRYTMNDIYNSKNNVLITGDPKVISGNYVFNINDKFYAIPQSRLEAFNNGKNTIIANTNSFENWNVVNENGEVIAVVKPLKVSDSISQIYDRYQNVSDIIGQEK